MSDESNLILCMGPYCKERNPRIVIDRINREREYLSIKGDDFRRYLLASIQRLEALPGTSADLRDRADTGLALKTRLRTLQKRMTKVCELLEKMERSVRIHVRASSDRSSNVDG